jgi:hypothetical protein
MLPTLTTQPSKGYPNVLFKTNLTSAIYPVSSDLDALIRILQFNAYESSFLDLI